MLIGVTPGLVQGMLLPQRGETEQAYIDRQIRVQINDVNAQVIEYGVDPDKGVWSSSFGKYRNFQGKVHTFGITIYQDYASTPHSYYITKRYDGITDSGFTTEKMALIKEVAPKTLLEELTILTRGLAACTPDGMSALQEKFCNERIHIEDRIKTIKRELPIYADEDSVKAINQELSSQTVTVSRIPFFIAASIADDLSLHNSTLQKKHELQKLGGEWKKKLSERELKSLTFSFGTQGAYSELVVNSGLGRFVSMATQMTSTPSFSSVPMQPDPPMCSTSSSLPIRPTSSIDVPLMRPAPMSSATNTGSFLERTREAMDKKRQEDSSVLSTGEKKESKRPAKKPKLSMSLRSL